MSEVGSRSTQYGTMMEHSDFPPRRPPRRRRRRWLWFMLFFLIVFGLALQVIDRAATPVIEPGSTLHVTISGRYVETSSPGFLFRALGDRTRSFLDLLSTLSLAEADLAKHRPLEPFQNDVN